jgi:hypothetical protein
MSVNDVRVGDRAVVQEVVTHQGLILALSRGTDHSHDPAGARSLLDLSFGEPFVIFSDSGDWGLSKGKGCVIDENEGGFRSILEIKDMETIFGGSKLDHPRRSKNLEDTPAIFAVICDLKLLTKLIEGEDIRNTASIKVNRSISKVGLLGSVECTFVTVNPDRSSRRPNVGNMFRLGEKVNCGLAIQEEEIRADWAAGLGCRLSEDDGISWGARGTDNVSVGCTSGRLDCFMGLGHDKDTVVV